MAIFLYIYIYIYIFIYLESVSPEECHEHVYMATPLSVFQKDKNGSFVRKENGATGLKF